MSIPLRRLDSGVFREAYKIVNCDLIVKFPLGTEKGESPSYLLEGTKHTKAEVTRLRKLAQFGVMKRFLPKIHYLDLQAGIVIMQYYPPFQDSDEQVTALGKIIQALIFKTCRVTCSDIHSGNVHEAGPKHAVIIDLGY